MNYRIASLPGDGVGPEVVSEGKKVLEKVAEISPNNINFEWKEGLIGGIAYDNYGHPLPEETTDIIDSSDAIYLGAVGGPKWDKMDLPSEKTPEKGALLPLRKKYDLFANLRPAKIFPALSGSSSLKQDIIEGGVDTLIVRELTGGLYFGKDRVKNIKFKEGYREGNFAYDVSHYSEEELRRIAKVACEAAMKMDKKVTSVDKANVLDTSKLGRKVIPEYVENNYPEIDLDFMYVDNAAMQIAINPKQFDKKVMLCPNMKGDIISDIAAAITGSIGMLPSASQNEKGFGMYEPVHGSAPDIAGKGVVNPLAQILSGKMMLESFDLTDEAGAVEEAINDVLNEGYRTNDIASNPSREKILSTSQMGDKVAEHLEGKL